MTTQRTAVVLAGSEGLGLASAQCLAREGHQVVIFSRSAEKLDAARASIEGSGPEVCTVRGDLSCPEDLERLFRQVEERFSGTDILVNNTGGPRPGTMLDLSDEDWNVAFQEQALSVIGAIRRVVPAMRRRRWGRIITIASLSVKAPIEGLDLSNFMRGGLAAVHRTLARTLAPDDVNVHMVLPGSIATARSRALIRQKAERLKVSLEEAQAVSVARIPKGRQGQPGDIGEVVAFLASERADYLTGNFMRVDGGMYEGID